MNTIFNELKNAFNRPNNSLYQLILINIIVFVILAIFRVIATFGELDTIFAFVYDQFSISPRFNEYIYRPWTLLSYAFSHDLTGVFHILMNMLVLYWFGKLVKEYLGSDKLIAIYVLGAIAGGTIFLISYNLIPFYIARAQIVHSMVGASASVFAVAVAAATLLPEHRFFLFFIGPVKIVYIVAFYIFISFIGIVGSNAGGDLAHLGGAFIGYLYIRLMQKGTDIGHFIIIILNYIKSFFVKQSKIKVSYKRKEPRKTSSKTNRFSGSKSSSKPSSSQEEIDAILDKINASGYESLSKDEKQKLFNAGK